MLSPSPRSRGYTLIEVLVIIGVVLIAIAFFIPFRIQCNRSSAGISCASNLRQIGQAILLYSDENGPAYPRTTYVPDASPIRGTGAPAGNPFVGNAVAPNDVTAELFLLLRTQEIGREVFTCPSANEVMDTFGGGTNTAANRSNFTDWTKNLSYSYTNPYPSAAAAKKGCKLTQGLHPEFAVAADRNPEIKLPDSDVTAIQLNSTPQQMKLGNATNHDRDGQNVLFGDGHLEFLTQSFVGIKNDNIYTVSDDPATAHTSKVIAGSPSGVEDSVLLP